MANVKTLSVSIQARTSQFGKAMKRAQRTISNFGKSVRGAVNRLGQFSGIAGLIGGGGLLLLTKNAFKSIDAMAKFSDTVGISVNALRGFELSAEKGGASAEIMRASLVKMLKNISDAGNGLMTPKRALDDLGLSFNELTNLTTEQKFLKIADALARIENKSTQTRVAMDIFGRSGVQLIQTMSAGADGIQQNVDLIKNMGLEMSRLDMAKIEVANDRMTELSTIFSAVIDKLAVQFAPVVGVIAKRLASMGNLGSASFDMIGQAIVIAGNLMIEFGRIIKVISGALKVVAGTATGTIAVLSGVAGGLQGLAEATKSFAKGEGFKSSANDLTRFADALLLESEQLFKDGGEDFGQAFSTGFGDGFKRTMKEIKSDIDSEAIKIAEVAEKKLANARARAQDAVGAKDVDAKKASTRRGGPQRFGTFNFARVSTDALAGQVNMQNKQLKVAEEQVKEQKKFTGLFVDFVGALKRGDATLSLAK